MKSLHLAVVFMLIYCCTCATISDFNSRNNENYLRTNALSSDDDGAVTSNHNLEGFKLGKSSVISPVHAPGDLRNPQNEESEADLSVKEKRCKSSAFTGNLLGSSHSPTAALPLTRRDIQSDLLKKRCETCKESSRCKKLGKCDICTKICDNYETSLNPKKGSKVLDIHERNTNEDIVGIASRNGGDFSDEVSGLSEKEDRYYTVGSFESGPVHNLLTRLLHIYNKDNIERLIVLAKAKTPGVVGNTPHPVVIDTAHVFTINEGGPKEIDVEVHKVKSGGDAEDLASKLNRELDVAIVHKKKLVGDSHLTADEIDEIIDHAVGRINGKQSPSSNELVGVARNLETLQNPNITVPQNNSDSEYNETLPATGKGNTDGNKKYLQDNVAKYETQTIESGHTEKVAINGEESVESDESTEATYKQVSTEIPRNNSNETPNLENRVAEDEVKIKQPTNSRYAQDMYGRPVIRNNYQQAPPTLDYLAPNYAQTVEQIDPGQLYKQPTSPPVPYQPSLNYPVSNPVRQQYPVKQNYDRPLDYINIPTKHLPQPISDNQYMIKNIPNSPVSSGLFYNSPEIVQPAEPYQQNTDENDVKDLGQDISITPYNQDAVNIYVPEGQVNEDFYVGNTKSENIETADNNFDDPNLATSINTKSWFENEYHKLRKWVDENVGMMPKTETIVGEPRQNKDIVHNVNDIINSVTTTAKDLNEKITDLVKKSDDSTELDTKSPSGSYVVKLENGKPFRTRLSPQEYDQISDKLNTNLPPTTTNLHPYDKHPRLKSLYRNGKWEYVKLPPKDLLGSQPQLIDGPHVDEMHIKNVPSQREPFIDPQLLDMKSIIQNVKHVNDHVFKSANDVVDILQSGQENKKGISPEIEPKLQINENQMVEQQTPEINSRIDEKANETVACSDEESDENLRENNISESSTNIGESGSNTTKVSKDAMQTKIESNVGREVTTGSVTYPEMKDSLQLKEDMLGSKQTTKVDGGQSNTEIIETTTIDDTVACTEEGKDKDETARSYVDYKGNTSKKSEHPKHVPSIEKLMRSKALDKILHPKPLDGILHQKSKASTDHEHHRKHPPSPTKTRPQYEINDQSDENSSNEKPEKIHQGQFNKDTSKDTMEHVQDQLPYQYGPNMGPQERTRQLSPYMQPFDINQRIYQDPHYLDSYRLNPNLMPSPVPPNMQQRYPNWQNGVRDMNEMIGSPRFQEPTLESFSHLGKFVPNHDQPLSVHSRDVSDQTKLRNMYFVGDGIKLPLNMKEHGDGTLHLSVDVKSLCDCKHCDGKHIHNGTLVLEELPSINVDDVKADVSQSADLIDDVPLAMASPTFSNDEIDKKFGQVAAAEEVEVNDRDIKSVVSKRSPRTKNSLDDNELEKDFEFHINDDLNSVTTHPNVNYKLVDPMEVSNNVSSGNFVKQKVGLLNNVFRWMTNIVLDDIESQSNQ